MFRLLQKIVAFHFHYLGNKRNKRTMTANTRTEENVPIEKHFDFRLNGSIDNESNYSHNRDLSYSFCFV